MAVSQPYNQWTRRTRGSNGRYSTLYYPYWSMMITRLGRCCLYRVVTNRPAHLLVIVLRITAGWAAAWFLARGHCGLNLRQYCGGAWIWGWQNCTSRAQKLEPHLLVKVHSASAPWLNHCRSQCNIRLAAEIDIVIFEWQQEGVGKQRLSNSCLKTGAGKAEVEQ